MIVRQNWDSICCRRLPEHSVKYWPSVEKYFEIRPINEHSVKLNFVQMKVPKTFCIFEADPLHLSFSITRKCNELSNYEKPMRTASIFMRRTIFQHSEKEFKLGLKKMKRERVKKCSELSKYKIRRGIVKVPLGKYTIFQYSEIDHKLDLKRM